MLTGSSSTTRVLAAALKYIDCGYKVFVCAPGGKRPATAHGFHDATTDPELVEKWWAANPEYNIGIACDELVVIDLDAKDGRLPDWPSDGDQRLDLFFQAGALATTPRSGRHLYFRCPRGVSWACSAGVIAPGVDVRTNGGYVVVAPSRTSDGEYRWLDGELDRPAERLPLPPGWLCDLLNSLAAKRSSSPSANGKHDGPSPAATAESSPRGKETRRWPVSPVQCDDAG